MNRKQIAEKLRIICMCSGMDWDINDDNEEFLYLDNPAVCINNAMEYCIKIFKLSNDNILNSRFNIVDTKNINDFTNLIILALENNQL